MANDQASYIVQRLIANGMAPHQAYAVAGHAQTESNFNPRAYNKGEGAHGIWQWRLDRWDNLQKFARDRGLDPYSLDAQIDFIPHELATTEARNAGGFLNSKDVQSATAALKPVIRFAHGTEGKRLTNALRIAGMPASTVAPSSAPTSVAAAGPGVGGISPGPAPETSPVNQTFAALQQIAQASLAGDAERPQIEPMKFAQPVGFDNARQIQQVMIRKALGLPVPGESA